MNRIILIGNGFDKAHGLQTGYADFINWYWDNWFDGLRNESKHIAKDGLITLTILDVKTPCCDFYESIAQSMQKHKGIDIYKELKKNDLCIITSNTFMEAICESVEEKGWVDIENTYYKLLCKFVKHGYNTSIEALNKDMTCLTDKLIGYLESEDKKCGPQIINEEIKSIICNPFRIKDIAIAASAEWDKIVKEHILLTNQTCLEKSANYFSIVRRMPMTEIMECFSSINKEVQDEELVEDCKAFSERYREFLPPFILQPRGQIHDMIFEYMLYPDKIMLLNFNYTCTAKIRKRSK